MVRGTEAKYEDTGRLDHIAFAATDVDGMRKRLQSKNVKFRESIVPHTGDTQFFLYDPDGVGVELNFPKARRRIWQVLRGVSANPDKVIGRPYLGREAVRFSSILHDDLDLAAAAAG